jgi:hypothetical protein
MDFNNTKPLKEYKMSTKQSASKKLLLPALLLVSGIATAAPVTIPNTFTSDTPAVAAEVNANFTAVKTAVDDNNARITANKARQDTHASDIGNLQIRTTSLENTGSRVISLGHTAFKNAGSAPTASSFGDCVGFGAFAGYLYPAPVATATNDQCFFSAGVQLPDNATISRLECTFMDNSASNSMNVHLQRTSMLTGVNTSILRTSATTDSAAIQTQNDTTFNTAGSETIDNSTYGYNLFLNFTTTNFTSLAENARLYGCRITVN